MSVYNSEKFPAFVFDLEGTLTNHLWRKQFHDNKQYDQYNLLFPYDGVNEKVALMFDKLSRTMFCHAGKVVAPTMFILTAKSIKYQNDVRGWLGGYLGLKPGSYILMMRLDHQQDMRSVDYKVAACDEISKSYDIKLAFDDRDDIIAGLLDHGYNVVDVKTLTGEAS